MSWKTLAYVLIVLVLALLTGLRYDYRLSNMVEPPQRVDERPAV